MAKSIVLLIWVAVISNLLFVYPPVLSTILLGLGVLLLIGHLVEYFMERSRINAKGHSAAKSFLMTMVFGVVYIKDL